VTRDRPVGKPETRLTLTTKAVLFYILRVFLSSIGPLAANRSNYVSPRRCLIPADGFYEWRREGNRKVPMWFRLKSREPFAFPGLWDCWVDRDSGSQLHTFTIITTRANALVRRIHYRMPVIYDKDMGRQWLEHSFGASPIALNAVLRPWPLEYMEAWDVSLIVNALANDSAECIRPLPAGRVRTGQLPLL